MSSASLGPGRGLVLAWGLPSCTNSSRSKTVPTAPENAHLCSVRAVERRLQRRPEQTEPSLHLLSWVCYGARRVSLPHSDSPARDPAPCSSGGPPAHGFAVSGQPLRAFTLAAALFTRAKRWEQPKYPLIDKWVRKCGRCRQQNSIQSGKGRGF